MDNSIARTELYPLRWADTGSTVYEYAVFLF